MITGCSSGGVGAALAEAFEDEGYHVFATARSPSKVPQSLHASPHATVLALDVASSDSIAMLKQNIQKETGGTLDILINNAGLGLEMPCVDTSIQEAKKLFDLNFFAAFEMIQVFSPMLIKASGLIINNSSVGGRCPIPFIGMYQATKAALIQASEVLRLEMAPLGVRVLTLLTGGVATNFLSNTPNLKLPSNSYYRSIEDIILQKPEEIAYSVSPEAFAKDVVRQVRNQTTGQYWIGGGASMARLMVWLLPQWIVDRFSLNLKPFAEKLAQDHKRRMQEE